jgi:eukaryotic-like serine/threonine-protein kinase
MLDWTPPAEFDGYRLIRLLGCGAMGEVHLALDTLLDRHVAIKFILQTEEDPNARARFLVEARAIARLQHPNVVAVYRVGEVLGWPYLVYEFVRGVGLDELPAPVPWEQALSIGMGIARGLATAHQRGVLHRDIKPANVILSQDGEVKLLDFGLAKLLQVLQPHPGAETAVEDGGPRPDERAPIAGGDPLTAASGPAASTQVLALAAAGAPDDAAATLPGPHLTRAGEIMGTPLYMAPEVWLGEPATSRSDVYSLGALLYALCSGRPPHDAETLALLEATVVRCDVPPLTSVAPEVNPALAAVVDRCLRRDPRRRYADGNDVRAALAALAPESRASPIPQGNPYRGLRPFEAEHRALFFGREAEVRSILERLLAEPFLLVAGDSGVGKSSLCRAGVLPAVNAAFGAGRTWSTVTVVPGRHPLAALAAGLAPFLGGNEDEVQGWLVEDPSSVGRELRRRLGAAAGLVIFVDQLEEVATLGEPGERAALGEALEWLAMPTPGVRLLAAVRGDFLSRLAALPGIGGNLGRALFFLRPLSRERVREVVVGPARALGAAFESDALVASLVESAVSTDGGLPLLQFALAQLWEARDQGRQMITAAALEALGGVGGALSRHADEVVAGLAPRERIAARRMLTGLVSAAGTRTRRTEAELGADDTAARAALEALVRGRLLVAREAPEGSAYELAHEVLILGWGTLRQWLEENAGSRAVRERLDAAVAEWERLDQAREALWSGRQLAEATLIGAGDLEPKGAAFLQASRAIARRRRLKVGLAVAAVPLAALLAYAVIAGKARVDLRRQIAGRVAEAARLVDDARTRDREVEQRRLRAFMSFDAAQVAAGEKLWGQAQALAAAVEASYARAGQTLESALVLDAGRRDVRDQLAAVLFARSLLAERDRRAAARDELLQRLALYDQDGVLRQRLASPAHLSVTTSPAGAAVRLERFLPQGERQRLGAARDLGAAPVGPVRLPPGSYVVTLEAPGHAPVRYPVLLGRGERVHLELDLPRAAQVAPGFVWVPPGRFLFGSAADEGVRRSFLNAAPLHAASTAGFLIAQHETTYRDWIEYLVSLPPADRARRRPRTEGGGLQGSLELREIGSAAWQLTLKPTTRASTARSGERLRLTGRHERASQDWQRLPVSGVTWDDARAYAAWLDRSGRVPGARLCTELEWERAARGADGREFPHGDALEPVDANYDETYGKEPLGFGPDEVGAHPASRSPFGVDDMCGNVWEWTQSVLARGGPVARGGSYYMGTNSVRSTNRELLEPTLRDATLGIRVCASLPPAPATPDRRAETAWIRAESARRTTAAGGDHARSVVARSLQQ